MRFSSGFFEHAGDTYSRDERIRAGFSTSGRVAKDENADLYYAVAGFEVRVDVTITRIRMEDGSEVYRIQGNVIVEDIYDFDPDGNYAIGRAARLHDSGQADVYTNLSNLGTFSVDVPIAPATNTAPPTSTGHADAE